MEDGKKEVIKHSAAIQIHNNITLLQRRAWNILLANAYDELPTKEEHSITIADLIRKLDFDSKNEDYLRESLTALVTCAVEWNILGKDKRQKWGVSTLLADAEIEGGVCNYSYGPKLRKRLHNPTMYARISLSMQNRFESKYALALWELCVDFLDVSRNSGETRFIPLEDFMDLMGVDRGGYAKEFKVLRRFVITPAIKEINKVTDFHVEEEYRRQNRKFIAIKFKVKREVFLPQQTQQRTLFRDLKDMPTAVRELKSAGIAADEAWKIWQEGFNYVEMDKRPTNFKDTPEATFDRYVLEKVHLLKRMQAEGKVKNITGFLRTAIKKNYANPEFAAEEAKKGAREQAKTRHLTERKRQLLEEQRAEIERSRDTEIHQLCERIAKETPALLEQAAVDLFKENPILKKFCESGRTLLENYQQKPMLRVMMNQHLMAHSPELFQTIHKRYEVQLAAFDQKMIAEEQASV
jgi:Initiator Replication protein